MSHELSYHKSFICFMKNKRNLFHVGVLGCLEEKGIIVSIIIHDPIILLLWIMN